jgi:hypothetical protein
MAPNDFANGTANKSQAKPFTAESGHSEPRIVTAVQARQGVISGPRHTGPWCLHLARAPGDDAFLSRRVLNELISLRSERTTGHCQSALPE